MRFFKHLSCISSKENTSSVDNKTESLWDFLPNELQCRITFEARRFELAKDLETRPKPEDYECDSYKESYVKLKTPKGMITVSRCNGAYYECIFSRRGGYEWRGLANGHKYDWVSHHSIVRNAPIHKNMPSKAQQYKSKRIMHPDLMGW